MPADPLELPCLCVDITRGMEPVPIPCFCRGESILHLLDYFKYESACVWRADEPVIDAEGCTCSGACSVSDCPCAIAPWGESWYDAEGHLRLIQERECGHVATWLSECGLACGCSAATCRQRRCQRGVTVKLRVVWDGPKGWTVQTGEELAPGTFVCGYFGEVVSRREAARRLADYDCRQQQRHAQPRHRTQQQHPQLQQQQLPQLQAPQQPQPASQQLLPLHPQPPPLQQELEDKMQPQRQHQGQLWPKPQHRGQLEEPATEGQLDHPAPLQEQGEQEREVQAEDPGSSTWGGHALLVLREVLPSGGRALLTCVDATLRGNVSRFINHSCDGGNLTVMAVRPAGALLPLICLFTRRHICAGEELTFSYSGTGGERRNSGTRCLCGTPCCTGFLPAQHI